VADVGVSHPHAPFSVPRYTFVSGEYSPSLSSRSDEAFELGVIPDCKNLWSIILCLFFLLSDLRDPSPIVLDTPFFETPVFGSGTPPVLHAPA